MPTYQYLCTECNGQLEVVQKFTDDALTVHDACGGRLRKVFSPVGIVFKGSGFYKTDSRKGTSDGGSKTETAAKSDSAAKTDGAAKTDPKSDSKPAAPSTSSTPAAKSA